MCLAIPGQIVDVVDAQNRLARVEVAGVQRNVNIGLLDGGEDLGRDRAAQLRVAELVDEPHSRTSATPACTSTSSPLSSGATSAASTV